MSRPYLQIIIALIKVDFSSFSLLVDGQQVKLEILLFNYLLYLVTRF